MPLALLIGFAICLAIDFVVLGQIGLSPILACMSPFLLRKFCDMPRTDSLRVTLFCAFGGTVVALVAGLLTAPMMSGTEPTYAFAFGVGVFGFRAAPVLAVLLVAFITSLILAKAKEAGKPTQL